MSSLLCNPSKHQGKCGAAGNYLNLIKVSHLHKSFCVVTVTGYGDGKGEGKDNAPCFDRMDSAKQAASFRALRLKPGNDK